MRLLSVTLLLLALLVAGCSTLSLNGSRVDIPIWVTEGETPLRANAIESALDPPLEQVWDFNAGAGFGAVSPLIVDDIALVATRKGEIHAIDLNTGSRLGQTSFGESIDGTPVIEDRIIYVPVSWGGRAIHAFDLTKGSTVWRAKGAPVSAGLTVFEDLLLAADVEGHVRAYDLNDGTVKWDVTLGDRVGVKAAPVLVDDRLIIGDDAGHVTALNALDGAKLWSIDIDAPVYAALAATEEAVFVPTTRGRLVSLDVSDGSIEWAYQAPSVETYIASPGVGENDIIFGASDGHVRSLASSDGALRWATEVDGAVTAAPLVTHGTVYVGTMRSKLFGLSREDGTRTWETELEGRVKSAFAAKGRRIVVLAEPRVVYLFQVSEESYAIRDN